MALELDRQVGPLPMGAWFAVVGIGGGLAIYAYRKQQANAATTVDTSGGSGVGGSGFAPVNPPTDGTGTTTPPITDNQAWGVAAINWLIAQGYDPNVADSAVRKYLAAQGGLSVQEFALIRLVLQHLGSPPDPLPPPGENPPPTPTPVPSPPPQAPGPIKLPKPPPTPAPPPHGTKTVTVGHWPSWNASLWGIATHYGHGTKSGVDSLYSTNKTVIEAAARAHGHTNSNNGNLIFAGTVLTLPAGW